MRYRRRTALPLPSTPIITGRAAMGGFTMIELMVVIAIAAILLAVAAPSFVKSVQRNRAATEVNSLVSDLQYARGQAVKTGQPVTVCVSTNGTSCSGGKGWEKGWILFTDVNADATVDSTETVLRVQPAFASSDTFGDSKTSSLTYSRDGFLVPLGSGVVSMTLNTTPANSNAARCLSVSTIGRQSVATGACS